MTSRRPDSHPRALPCSTDLNQSVPSAALSTTGWTPRGELAISEWARQGRWLGALGRASGWWLGDWIRYGNARYGDKYAPAAKATGYDVQSLMNMAYVAGRFDVSRRRENLSFSHHAELAGLPTPDQDLWLDHAEANGLSVRSLRARVLSARRHADARQALRESRNPGDRQGSSSKRGKTLATKRIQPSAPACREDGTEPTSVCPSCGRPFPESFSPDMPKRDTLTNPRP